MSNLKKALRVPLLFLLIGLIMMFVIGTSNTFMLFGSDTSVVSLIGAIIFSVFLGIGLFSLVVVMMKVAFFTDKPTPTIKTKLIKYGKYTVICIFALVITLTSLLGTLLVYYYVRLPPSYEVDSNLELETWTAVPGSGLAPGNGLEKHHKSNTDMFFWNGNFYLVYQNSKWHIEDINGELVVARSPDASEGSWVKVASVKGPGQNDVRDPLITDINGTLFLFFLPNFRFDPGPNTTYICTSEDGTNWSEPEELPVNVLYPDGWKKEAGWVFGRQEPITRDGITWYVMASGRKDDQRMTILLESTDGLDWSETSVVYDTYGSGEPCMIFLPNGELICTLRVGAMSSWTGYEFGTPHAGTIIATSYNNLKNWSYAPEFQTRMDGGRLFTLDEGERIFIAGRNHLGPRIDIGNHISRKRTAIYEVFPDRLIHLFDLPSNGDTAYTGVVLQGDDVFVSYYTNPINKDLPWIVGLAFYSETEIRIAKFSASGLLEYANNLKEG